MFECDIDEFAVETGIEQTKTRKSSKSMVRRKEWKDSSRISITAARCVMLRCVAK